MTDKTKALLPVTPELLLCGNCGAPARWVKNAWRIKCTRPSCGVEGGKFEQKHVAITAWNTRISHSLPGDVDEDDLLDLIDEAIGESGDEEWTPRDAARHVIGAFEHEGLVIVRGAALTPSPCPGDGMREALVNDNEWVCAGIPDEAIEAGIAAWRAADVAMMAREESEHPEDMADWDEGMIVAAIFKAVGRSISGPSALSGDAGEGRARKIARDVCDRRNLKRDNGLIYSAALEAAKEALGLSPTHEEGAQ